MHSSLLHGQGLTKSSTSDFENPSPSLMYCTPGHGILLFSQNKTWKGTYSKGSKSIGIKLPISDFMIRVILLSEPFTRIIDGRSSTNNPSTIPIARVATLILCPINSLIFVTRFWHALRFLLRPASSNKNLIYLAVHRHCIPTIQRKYCTSSWLPTCLFYHHYKHQRHCHVFCFE